jgi:hypothetical protein
LKLDADGGVLQEIVSQSFSRTPNSTLPGSANGHHTYEFENGDHDIEVERPKTPVSNYMDDPKGGRRSVNEYGGNIL